MHLRVLVRGHGSMPCPYIVNVRLQPNLYKPAACRARRRKDCDGLSVGQRPQSYVTQMGLDQANS